MQHFRNGLNAAEKLQAEFAQTDALGIALKDGNAKIIEGINMIRTATNIDPNFDVTDELRTANQNTFVAGTNKTQQANTQSAFADKAKKK